MSALTSSSSPPSHPARPCGRGSRSTPCAAPRASSSEGEHVGRVEVEPRREDRAARRVGHRDLHVRLDRRIRLHVVARPSRQGERVRLLLHLLADAPRLAPGEVHEDARGRGRSAKRTARGSNALPPPWHGSRSPVQQFERPRLGERPEGRRDHESRRPRHAAHALAGVGDRKVGGKRPGDGRHGSKGARSRITERPAGTSRARVADLRAEAASARALMRTSARTRSG